MSEGALLLNVLDADERREAALLLARAERERHAIAPLTDRWPRMTLADAYAIQRINTATRIEAGARVRGHKVGLTSEAMQRMVGVDTPDFGLVLDDMVIPAGEPLRLGDLVAARAEPEIAFLLAMPLRGPGIDEGDVVAATAYVLPALEIIDSRIVDWNITLCDTVADNASSGKVALGSKETAVDDTDLAAIEVELAVDGVPVSHGVGADVLGHPAAAVAWLANTIAEFGEGLEAGQLVLPGSLTRAIELAPGTTVAADFGPLGSVELECT